MESEKIKLNDFISASLVSFIEDQLGTAGLESLDEIVLGYVTSVVNEMAWVANSGKEVNENQQEFFEIMSLYIPRFMTISKQVVSDWIVELGDQVRKTKYPNGMPKEDSTSCAFVNFMQNIGKEGSYTCYRSRRFSEPECSSSSSSSASIHIDDDGESPPGPAPKPSGKVNEMDYDASSSSDDPELIEPLRVLKLYRKHQSTDGRTVSTGNPRPLNKKRSALEASLDAEGLSELQQKPDDLTEKMKDKIVARYGFVEEHSDVKANKPKIPKPGPTKLIRFREGEIVSTSGKAIEGIKDAKADLIRTFKQTP